MVFVPPDRTARRERMSRVGAVACVVVAALACLCVAAFGGHSGTKRIAVVHRALPSPTPTPSSHTRTPLPPPRTYAALSVQLPLPAGATRISKAKVPTWHAATSLTATKQFYERALLRVGLRWHPVAVHSGKRVTAWAGTVDTTKADVIARLSVRASPRYVVIAVRR